MSFVKARELVQLATMAASHRGVSLHDIETTFGCARRTAQRMTNALEGAFPATERRIDDEGKARWILPARAVVHFLEPAAEELAALRAAIPELEREGWAPECQLLRQLEAKVKALIPQRAAVRLEVDEEALLVALGHAARPGPRPIANPPVDTAIYAALKGPNLLRIVYRGQDDRDEARERTVAPHGLLLGTRRYLVALDTNRTDRRLRHYRVDKISSAEVMPESFELIEGFDIRKHARRGFGLFESQAEYGEVVWKFTSQAAPHAQQYEFHPDQQLEPQADGSLIVRFHASGHLEMCWHLYAWGDSVEILAPEALRALVEGYRRKDFQAFP